MEKQTFQQFLDESAASLARLAARGIRALEHQEWDVD